ncbi:MAG TPA: methyltransferase domain-containing protein [Azospirillum sp.]|nr:methyltransferase domain-containing protein [Azospirillum sp.]
MGGYVHGYSAREAERLADQASILRPLLHGDTRFPAGTRVLEPGCGTGMQTRALLDGSPGIDLTCLDVDAGQLARARDRLGERGETVTFRQGDLLDAPFPPASFDAAFVCFLLEHLTRPAAALATLRRLVRPGGSIVVVEGDHGSCRFHPETPAALAAWSALVACQRRLGGDPDIGRRLYGLLDAAGFTGIVVEPRMVYADAGRAELRDGFVRRIIVPMVGGVRDAALGAGLIDAATWARGLADLDATADGREGAFCYTFFKATARIPGG